MITAESEHKHLFCKQVIFCDYLWMETNENAINEIMNILNIHFVLSTMKIRSQIRFLGSIIFDILMFKNSTFAYKIAPLLIPSDK